MLVKVYICFISPDFKNPKKTAIILQEEEIPNLEIYGPLSVKEVVTQLISNIFNFDPNFIHPMFVDHVILGDKFILLYSYPMEREQLKPEYRWEEINSLEGESLKLFNLVGGI